MCDEALPLVTYVKAKCKRKLELAISSQSPKRSVKENSGFFFSFFIEELFMRKPYIHVNLVLTLIF